jgi:hypothetical protein
MNLAMQTNLSTPIKQPNRLFASALLALSLLGSFHPHHMNYANGRSDANVVHLNQVEQTSDDFIYTPPRSPAFDNLLGS